MKNSYLAIGLVMIITAFAVYSCEDSSRTNGGSGTFLTSNGVCTNCADAEISTLQVNLIHEMVEGFKNDKLVNNQGLMEISERISKYEDAQSIWFSLDTLKKFICQMERISRENDPQITSSDLGLHIYYSRYPDNDRWGVEYPDLTDLLATDLTMEYENHHTLIMIPTIKKDNLIRDFNPKDPRTYDTDMYELIENDEINPNGELIYGPDSKIPMPVISVYSGDPDGGPDDPAQNHGSLFPPGIWEN